MKPAIRIAFRKLDTAIHLRILDAERAGHVVACRPGCSACCHQHVWVLPVEGDAIAQHVRERLGADDLAEFIARAEFQLAQATTLSRRDFWAAQVPCCFLDVDRGECRIYDARPSQCRAHHSLGDAEDCGRRPATPKGLKLLNHGQALDEFAAITEGDRRAAKLLCRAFLDAASPTPRPVPRSSPSAGCVADYLLQTVALDHLWFVHEAHTDPEFARAIEGLRAISGLPYEDVRGSTPIEFMDRIVRAVRRAASSGLTKRQRAEARDALANVDAIVASYPCECPP